MQQITGDIEVMQIDDIVAWLANRNQTGVLVVSRGNVKRSFIIASGLVHQGASSDPREYLGQHLINFGYIDEIQLEKGFKTQRETNIPLGQILIMVGQLSEEQLNRALAFKVRESLLDCFEWNFGSFQFVLGETGRRELDLALPVSLAEVHSEGQSRKTIWTEMRRIFTSGDMTCTVHKHPDNPSRPDAAILALLEQRRTISDLLLEMRALEFHVYARLYDLYQRGYIRPVFEHRDANFEPHGMDMHDAMQNALERQDFDEAYLSAQQALDHDSHDADAHNALSLAKEHFAQQAQAQHIDNSMVAELLISHADAQAKLQTAKERYVLSRVDGQRTLKQIIQVSPISELEFMRIIEHFLAKGLIALH